MNFADKISTTDKHIIWHLYFDKMYSYAYLERIFKGKYTYSQLKSIILSRIRDGNTI